MKFMRVRARINHFHQEPNQQQQQEIHSGDYKTHTEETGSSSTDLTSPRSETSQTTTSTALTTPPKMEPINKNMTPTTTTKTTSSKVDHHLSKPHMHGEGYCTFIATNAIAHCHITNSYHHLQNVRDANIQIPLLGTTTMTGHHNAGRPEDDEKEEKAAAIVTTLTATKVGSLNVIDPQTKQRVLLRRVFYVPSLLKSNTSTTSSLNGAAVVWFSIPKAIEDGCNVVTKNESNTTKRNPLGALLSLGQQQQLRQRKRRLQQQKQSNDKPAAGESPSVSKATKLCLEVRREHFCLRFTNNNQLGSGDTTLVDNCLGNGWGININYGQDTNGDSTNTENVCFTNKMRLVDNLPSPLVAHHHQEHQPGQPTSPTRIKSGKHRKSSSNRKIDHGKENAENKRNHTSSRSSNNNDDALSSQKSVRSTASTIHTSDSFLMNNQGNHNRSHHHRIASTERSLRF